MHRIDRLTNLNPLAQLFGKMADQTMGDCCSNAWTSIRRANSGSQQPLLLVPTVFYLPEAAQEISLRPLRPNLPLKSCCRNLKTVRLPDKDSLTPAVECGDVAQSVRAWDS